jgi:hypothetical protein
MTLFSMLARIPQLDDPADDDEFCAVGGDPAAFFGDEPATATVVAFPTGAPMLVDDKPAHVSPMADPVARFRVLGMTRSKAYVFATARGGVTDGHFRTYTETQLSESTLLTLAPLAHWQDAFGDYNEKTGRTRIDWLAAKDHIIGEAARVGWFNAKKIRGRGVWLDGKHVVVNAGDALVVDGQRISHADPRARELDSIYEADEPLGIVYDAEPMSAAESAAVLNILHRFNWSRPVDACVVTGWIYSAMICGVLPWRPHLWVVGEAGSGKSTVLNKVISEMLRAVGDTYFLGSTTEAGIRQTMKGDALPAAFDEPESTNKEGAARVQKVLEFLRVAASDQRGKLSKGSPSGNAVSYEARAMFALASIVATIKQTSDESRIVKVMLEKRDVTAASTAAWTQLELDIAELFSPANAARFAVRAHRLARTFLETAETMRRVLSLHFNNKRDGDVYGVLAAGAWHTAHDEALVDVADANAFLRACGFFDLEASSTRGATDEEKCKNILLDMNVEVTWQSAGINRRENGSVERWLDQLHSGHAEGDFRARAWAALRYSGLMLGWRADDDTITPFTENDMLLFSKNDVREAVILVCTGHPRIIDAYNNSEYQQWSSSYSDQLARAGGRYKDPIRFGGKQSRPVWIKYNWDKSYAAPRKS